MPDQNEVLAWWGGTIEGYTYRPVGDTVPVPVDMLIGLRDAVIAVLCSQALSDHLGDVRDAERHLWALLGVEHKEVIEHTEDSAFDAVRQVLSLHGMPLPEHLRDHEWDGGNE